MTDFNSLGLAAPLLKTLAIEGYTTPTPIQAQSIPHLLNGRDLLGIAQTGTGKTAAFALPILQRLSADRKPPQRGVARCLVLSPTRELTSQIAESFRTYGKGMGLKIAVAFGGVGHRPQADAMHRGIDILVATPGRLMDHMESGNLSLAKTEIIVLDEADQMLDLGFIHAIRKIVKSLPKERQSLFFSATMPKAMGEIVADFLNDPVRVAVAAVAKTADRVDQRVIFIETARKRTLLTEILQGEGMGRTLVFTRTKHGADRIIRQLEQDGIAATAIHGNKSQGQREKALAGFKSGVTPILIATDIAARGIDVNDVTHVINFDLPNVPESYVHRIGRTARAGAEGIAISFCDGEERAFLRDIERLTRQTIPSEDRRNSKDEDRPSSDRARPVSSYKNPRPQQQRFNERRTAEGRSPRTEGGFNRDRPRSDAPRTDAPRDARPSFGGENRARSEGAPRDTHQGGFSGENRTRPEGASEARPRSNFNGENRGRSDTPRDARPSFNAERHPRPEARINERAFEPRRESASLGEGRERPAKQWRPETNSVTPEPAAERKPAPAGKRPFAAKPGEKRDGARPDRAGRPERGDRDIAGVGFLRPSGGKPRPAGPKQGRPPQAKNSQRAGAR